MQNNGLELTVTTWPTKKLSKFRSLRYWQKSGKIWQFGLDGHILTVFCKYLRLQYSDNFFVCYVVTVSSTPLFCIQETQYLRSLSFWVFEKSHWNKKPVYCKLGKIEAIQKKVVSVKSACFCDSQPILGEHNRIFELDHFQPTLMYTMYFDI